MRTLAHKQNRSGMSLVEIMVASGIGSIVLTAVMVMWGFGSRSFVAMGNYRDLDAKSQYALDMMSREIRQATRVIDIQNTGTTKWLTLTNVDAGVRLKYSWDATERTLTYERSGQEPMVLLRECDAWQFAMYQRTPQKNQTNTFFPAKNVNGNPDMAICKLVDMSWKCSRKILGQKVNTESVQTAQIVLRNKQ